MRSLSIFVLALLSISFSLYAACPIPQEKVLQYYLKEHDLNPKVSVEVQDFSLGQIPAKILHAPISCGLQGCDYTILVGDSSACFTEAFSFSGRYIPLKAGEWDKLEIKFKSSPVDDGKKTPRLYFFNSTTKTYQPIPKPL